MKSEKMCKCPFCNNKIEISYCYACGEPFAHEPGIEPEYCSKECEKIGKKL